MSQHTGIRNGSTRDLSNLKVVDSKCVRMSEDTAKALWRLGITLRRGCEFPGGRDSKHSISLVFTLHRSGVEAIYLLLQASMSPSPSGTASNMDGPRRHSTREEATTYSTPRLRDPRTCAIYKVEPCVSIASLGPRL